jgi:hypothetical protein
MTTYPKSRRVEKSRFATSIAATIALISVLVTPSGVAASAAVPCPAGSNEIVCENLQTGADPEEWDIDGAGDRSIQGFSTDISVNVGSTIDFKIDTDAADYTIDIYRTGWYGGKGARLIDSVQPIGIPRPPSTPYVKQPVCRTQESTGLYDCGTWNVSASWDVPESTVSGVFVALLTRTDTGGKSQITFIVRDDASHSDVLFQTSDPTWHAYNTYGGSDFYQGGENGRAYKVSYNRPFYTRGDNEGRDFYFSNEYPMVRFLEKQGYDVSYFSGVDTDRRGSQLLNHNVFLSVGHDEYWSAGQRANVEAARDAGVNLQFLSGNEAYWRTRYEPSADLTATPYRTLVSYKETWASKKLDDTSPAWTGTWRDPRFASPANGGGLPENALTGTAYMANDDDLAITVTAAQGKTRMWRNTGLAGMTGPTQALAPHTIGYESDEALDNGFMPSGLIKLSATTGHTPQYLQDYGRVVLPGTTTHNVTLYRAASGALVFGAGTIQWAWGIDQEHDGYGAAADLRMQQAQVNLLADMDALPSTLRAPLVAATPSTDTTAPVVTITSPSAGANIPNGSNVVLTGTVTDIGGIVAGVNVSTDGGATWHPATGTTSFSYNYVQHGKGLVPVLVRAIDDSGNYSATPKTVSFSVTGPYSVLGNEIPDVPDAGDGGALQLGLKFTASIDGFISGVRFYKSAANTGAHTGSLWSSTGTRLATLDFVNETATGWQSANFVSPVAVTAGSKYVVSYYAPKGHYSASNYHWISRGATAGPLTVAGGYAAHTSDPAGVFTGGDDSFPDRTSAGTNYYVDAIFDTVDTSPLVVAQQWPLAGSSSVPVATNLTATFSKAAVASTVQLTVTAVGGGAVAGVTTYDAATKTATFDPNGSLAAFKQYSVTVTGTDALGSPVSSGGSWTFTTAKADPPAGVCPCGLFGDGAIPQTLQVGDNNAVSLGVRFTPTSNGTIDAIEFYKTPANSGAHVATLWSSTGAHIADASFSSETTAGWQRAAFSTPVPVTAGTTYVASYRAPVGAYSATGGAFATGFTRGPLTVGDLAGVYTYGTTAPLTQTSTNYHVDVEFSPVADPITVVSKTPGSGATLVPRNSAVVVQLSRAVAPGYSLAIASGGTPVSGATTLSGGGTVITFTPASPLPNGAVVQATLSGVVSTQGAQLANQSWSFTTVNEATTTVTDHTLFGTETPAVSSAAGETDSVELGLSFTPSVAGSVTALRFYKGAGNTGTHVGRLWSAAGESLAEVTFFNETASGWQTAQLSNAVPLTPGQTYVVSYLAPQGRYSYTSGYFSSPKTSGPLTAGTANNGRFRYGAGGVMPTTSWGGANYFVDVVYSVSSTK